MFGHSNMRVSIRKGKIFHQHMVFAARQNSTFLSQTQNQLYVALKMTFQMLFLFSYLFVEIRYFSTEKKKALGNQFPWHSPTLKAGRKMQHLGMVSTGTRTDTHTFRARPRLLNVHSLPGPAEKEYSILDLAQFYQPLETQGQTDSIVHSFIFFTLGKIRKFILSYFRLFWALERSEIRTG